MDDSRTPMLAMTPNVGQEAKTHKFFQRTAKNEAEFAAEGFTPTSGDSTFSEKSQTLKILYVGGKVTDFAEAVGANPNNMALEMQAANQAMDEKKHWAMIHGNKTADPLAFDGLLVNTVNDSRQVIDNGGSVLTIENNEDVVSNFKNLMAKNSTDKKKPDVIAYDNNLYPKLRKLMLAASNNNIAAITGTVKIGGYLFEDVLVYDGIPILELDDLRDWVSDAPTFAAAKAAGGSVTADTYYIRVAAVTNDGETTAAAESTVTTETTNLKVNVTLTQADAHKYYKIYWGTATGVLKLVKTVKNDGEATQVVSFTSIPDSLNETPLDANEGIAIATKLGNRDGYEFGVNEEKTFVRLGKKGDYEEFYVRSYINGKLKNEYAVVKMQAKKA